MSAPKLSPADEARIREAQANFPSQTGRPYMAALKTTEGTSGSAGQRWILLIFPTTDAAYTLSYQCFINPDYLTGAFPYAYGGAQHAETFLEACLSVAESRKDDSFSVHKAEFAARLAASIAMDRKNKPQKLGLNRARSDERGDCNYNPHWYAGNGTYNGMTLG